MAYSRSRNEKTQARVQNAAEREKRIADAQAERVKRRTEEDTTPKSKLHANYEHDQLATLGFAYNKALINAANAREAITFNIERALNEQENLLLSLTTPVGQPVKISENSINYEFTRRETELLTKLHKALTMIDETFVTSLEKIDEKIKALVDVKRDAEIAAKRKSMTLPKKSRDFIESEIQQGNQAIQGAIKRSSHMHFEASTPYLHIVEVIDMEKVVSVLTDKISAYQKQKKELKDNRNALVGEIQVHRKTAEREIESEKKSRIEEEARQAKEQQFAPHADADDNEKSSTIKEIQDGLVTMRKKLADRRIVAEQAYTRQLQSIAAAQRRTIELLKQSLEQETPIDCRKTFFETLKEINILRQSNGSE